MHPTKISNREKVELREKLGEERYQEWLNQPPIQFPLRPDSPIRNDYSNSISSQAGNGGNQIEVGMDDYLSVTIAMETMLLDAFQNDDQLGFDAHIADTFFESLKFSSTTHLFGPGGQSKSTQLGTTMLLYNLKEKFWLVECMFLRNFEVSYHKVLPYINLKNIISKK